MNQLRALQFVLRVLDLAARPHRAGQGDDRGAITVETAIITAVIGALAVAVTAIIVIRANGWAAGIPAFGG
jgi:hypothetical protein